MKNVWHPIVEKYKLLLLVCWVHRLIRGIMDGKAKLVPYEFRKTKDELERSQDISALFAELGLLKSHCPAQK